MDRTLKDQSEANSAYKYFKNTLERSKIRPNDRRKADTIRLTPDKIEKTIRFIKKKY